MKKIYFIVITVLALSRVSRADPDCLPVNTIMNSPQYASNPQVIALAEDCRILFIHKLTAAVLRHQIDGRCDEILSLIGEVKSYQKNVIELKLAVNYNAQIAKETFRLLKEINSGKGCGGAEGRVTDLKNQLEFMRF